MPHDAASVSNLAAGAAAVSNVAAGAAPVPGGDALRQHEHTENFPVAMRVLPRDVRIDLHRVYAVARTIDELGDAASGDRTAQLHDFRTDLHVIWHGGTPRRPVLRALAGTVRARGLTAEPFDHLIDANLVDQRVTHYDTFDDLLGYCRLSADPVGRLVLELFGQSSPATIALSNRVCRALQLLEHWQDVAEDRRAGRVYLPREDLATYGVPETDLDRTQATVALRELLAFETERAARLLDAGPILVADLRGWARVAVAGYVAGGLAVVRSLRRAGWDVLGRTTAPRRRDIALSAASLLMRPRTERRDRS
jgi:squalene synthase HpnC